MPGYHLPFLAAATSGLFAEQNLEVEILEPAPGPDNVRRVAAGGSDFCLTSVVHYLTARAQSGPLAARFASVVVQSSPIAGIVAADSRLFQPADLSGRRLGGPADSRLVAEYQAGLRHLGLAPSVLVPTDYGAAPGALGRGEVDVVADFVDLVPRTRRQAGVDVRAVPLPLDVYSSGLVAADRLPDDLVQRMASAVATALQRQRHDPLGGLAELGRRYPGSDPDEALEGWALAEPNIFTGVEPGTMEHSRWEATLAFLTDAHGFPPLEPDTVYRPEMAAVAGPR
ncbi:MAG: ABC transporter substrate-binding protein [Actinobacteria bacterium]|nr:ABC transporter substrate-binding protein [Actinomycetota bacterium]